MIEQPVQVALFVGGIGAAIELAASMRMNSELRKFLYAVSLLMTACSATILVAWYVNLPVLLIGLVAGYRVYNGLRVLRDRMHKSRLLTVTRRTSWWLFGYQLVSLLLFMAGSWNGATAKAWLFSLVLAALLAAAVMLQAVRYNLRKTGIRQGDRYRADMDLPTVSVCIPARNETEDLEACLASVLASDYPKLEVIVLDDCSHHTVSETIRSLARSGVRFIHGRPPAKGWLAKNQAYDVLSEHASGELLLFLGVDVRLDKRAVSALVASLSARKKQMISVLPMGLQKREDSGLVQPMRYWWELALPRRYFNRPPALSTAWIISREALQKAGGFKAVSNTVIPESYFARELAADDGYGFMRASNRMKIYSGKDLEEQWETALRLRYPQLRHRPESVLLLTVAELVFLVLPVAVFLIGFFVPLGLIWPLAGLTTLVLGYIHYRIIEAWQVPNPLAVAAAFPVAVVLELIVLQVSMHKYEFGTVVWKDRNICIQVMKTSARLQNN